jgi:hypothetical protein
LGRSNLLLAVTLEENNALMRFAIEDQAHSFGFDKYARPEVRPLGGDMAWHGLQLRADNYDDASAWATTVNE